jgi:uncharacterized protein involved in exopolysaccharide biosynthesis
MRPQSAQQKPVPEAPRSFSPAAVLSDWSLRPRYTVADLLALLWRERVLIAAVFGVLFLLGAAFALTRPTTYAARSSLLVQLGQEYVYQPRAGDAGRGVTPDIDQMTQSEVEILTSGPLTARTIEKVGYGRLYPKNVKRYAAADQDGRARMIQRAVADVNTALAVQTTPKSNVIRLSYEHKDAQVAAAVLNAHVAGYLQYRREVLSDVTLPLVTQQRHVFEKSLAEANTSLQDFLATNRIGDFVSEKVSLGTLEATLREERYRVQARLREVEGRLGGLNRAPVAAQIDLYRDVDNTAENRLRDLRIQREELLSRYKPNARPVQEVEVQVAQLERMLREGRGVTAGARREGLNPIYQTVETERIQLRAEQASLANRRAAIDGQLAEVNARRMLFTRIEPQYEQLVRQRATLETNLRAFLSREQEQQAAQAIAQEATDNIRVVQRALPPAKGSSLRGELLIVSFLFAALTALCVALGRIFLRRSFPTAASASRTLDLPVLATASFKGAPA